MIIEFESTSNKRKIYLKIGLMVFIGHYWKLFYKTIMVCDHTLARVQSIRTKVKLIKLTVGKSESEIVKNIVKR